MFARDVDLMSYESRLFHEVAWSGQRLLDGAAVGTINTQGDRLTVDGADFDSWQVDAGWVVIVDHTPLEIVERINNTQLRISRVRLLPDDPLMKATPGSALPVRLHTFRHQRQEAARAILTMLNLTHSADAGPDDADESAITNPGTLRRAEVFGALALIYNAAAPGDPDGALWRHKADTWASRFRSEMRRVRVGVDLAGDGAPTEVRRTDTRRLERG